MCLSHSASPTIRIQCFLAPFPCFLFTSAFQCSRRWLQSPDKLPQTHRFPAAQGGTALLVCHCAILAAVGIIHTWGTVPFSICGQQLPGCHQPKAQLASQAGEMQAGSRTLLPKFTGLEGRETAFSPRTDVLGTGNGGGFSSCQAHGELLDTPPFPSGGRNQLWYQIYDVCPFHATEFWGRAKHTQSPERPLPATLH